MIVTPESVLIQSQVTQTFAWEALHEFVPKRLPVRRHGSWVVLKPRRKF